jgi:CheY-like chemotaxis protein
VYNGKQALQALECRSYEIILTDVKMPEMDGFEATKKIRKRWPAAKQPWITAVTAYTLEGDRKKF